VWNDVDHIFVEYEPFCQAVLRKHWPEASIHGDIRAFVADARSKKSHRLPSKLGEEMAEIGDCHLLTGGFPCQPFSHAGRRKGTADDRYLWPAMLESIAIFHPRWVIAENVAGLVSWSDGLVLETVCADLEKEGYEVQPFVIPAAAVGAPHRRDRVWIVAHRIDARLQGRQRGGRARYAGQRDRIRQDQTSHSPDPARFGRGKGDTQRGGLQEGKGALGPKKRRGPLDGDCNRLWKEDWPQVAAQLCTVDDGLSAGLVRPKGWRNAALKAAGNAIVPQVAEEIMRIIKSVDAL
jgi:DNA (cytosine-5)-methyltransferase 1